MWWRVSASNRSKIVGFDGVSIEDYHQLQRMSSEAEVGRTVKVDVMRRREKKRVELKVAEAPDSGPSAESRPISP